MIADSADCTALSVISGDEKKEKVDESVLEIPRFVQLTRRYLALVCVSCEAFFEMERGVKVSKNCLQRAAQAVSLESSGTSYSVDRTLTQLVRAVDSVVALNATTLKLLRPEVPSPVEDSQEDHDLTSRFQGLPLHQIAAFKVDFHRLGHDLNNMLTVAKGRAEMASLRSGEGDRVLSLLKDVGTALDRMELILSQQMRALSENALVGQRVAELSVVFCEVDLEMKERLVMTVDLDATIGYRLEELGLSHAQFKSLLFCLCDNAQKAGASKLQVRVSREGVNLSIELKDNGPGFKGLDPLEAARKSQQRSSLNGNGIPLCTRFCKQAGGSLTLVDPHAIGAEWKIVLPLRAASPH